jgi:hypothetical protein
MFYFLISWIYFLINADTGGIDYQSGVFNEGILLMRICAAG